MGSAPKLPTNTEKMPTAQERRETMDATAVFVAAGGWLVTVIGFIVTVLTSQRKADEKQNDRMNSLEKQVEIKNTELKGTIEKQTELTKLRIEELTKHVEKHNSVIERTFLLEKKSEVLEEKINVANNRIKDLEGGKK